MTRFCSRFSTAFIPLVFSLAGSWVASASVAGGQAELATFRGKVTDGEGRPVDGATVRLTDLSRGGDVEFETDGKGNFYRRGLRPSDYEISIEKEGFQPYEGRMELRAGEEKQQEIRIVPAATPAEVAFQKGIEAFNQGSFEEAVRAFEEVTRLAPEAPEGHTNLALAYVQLKRIPDAVQELEKATELSPDSFRTWAQLAMAYVQVDRLEAAVGAFETALSKEHDPSDDMAFESWMALGALYFSDGKVTNAVGAYEKALVSSPGSAAALVSLGKCHFNLGDMERALERFRQVVALAPNSPEANEARAFIEELEKK